MPAILDRLVSQLTSKGYPSAKAHAIATSQLQKHGILNKHSELTVKGAKRQAMGADGRAKDRAVKAGGGKPSDYVYNKKTNRATKKM